jgi:hypothetical protein
MFLDHRKIMRPREGSDRRKIGLGRAKLLRKLLTRQVAPCILAVCELPHPVPQHVGLAAAKQHRNLQPFPRIGLADRLRAWQLPAFATFKWMMCHSAVPPH